MATKITKGLVELPRHQRLALIRLLLDLDCPGTDDEIDVAWDEEIRARVRAVERTLLVAAMCATLARLFST